MNSKRNTSIARFDSRAPGVQPVTIQWLIDMVLGRAGRVLVLIALISIPLTAYFLKQTHNNHIDIFFEPDDPRLVAYQEFQKTYGNEEFVFIALEGEPVFTPRRLATIRHLSDALEAIDGIDRVYSLTNAEIFEGGTDKIARAPIVPAAIPSADGMDPMRRRVAANPILRDTLLSKNGTMTALHVELEAMREDRKLAAVRRVLAATREIAGNDFRIYCSGLSVIEVELNRLSEEDFMVFIPVILVLIFTGVLLLLRRVSLAVVCLANMFVILIWGIGFFVLCGETFNIVTTVIGAVLLAIAIADSIHILSHLEDTYRAQEPTLPQALRHTMNNVWFPCLFTSLTTGAGFVSFVMSDIRPVAVLGLFTAAGVMFAFFLSVTALPALLVVNHRRVSAALKKSGRRNATAPSTFSRFLNATGSFAVRRRGSLALTFLGVTVLSVIGIFQLEFETNTTRYLPDGNRFKQDLAVIETHFGGTIPFVLLVQSLNDDFTTARSLHRADTVQSGLLDRIAQFTDAFSVVDYTKEFNQALNDNDPAAYTIPANDSDIGDAYELGDPEILDRIIAPDHKEICLTFRSVWDSNEAAYRMTDGVNRYLAATLGDGYRFLITGLSSLYLTMDKHLQESQIKSFLLAFVIIFLMMFVVCRNLKLTIIAMIPNLFPIAVTLGIMGWFDIPLDVATTMIASVTIGIAVDDTIHFISWLRRNVGRTDSVAAAIVQTFADVGKPIVITTCLLFVGFFVLVLGRVLPTQAFGVLTAFSMLFAMIGDLLVLPALILIFKPKIAGLD